MRGALGRFARQVLDSPRTRDRGLLDVDAALRRLDAPGTSFDLWRCVSLELWARSQID